jgi:SAM-dependent methyltransferase
MSKSATDIHWDERALHEKDAAAVNIADVSQRELETDFLLKNLQPTDKVLEVGCGNGFLTSILRQKVSHVDAFDYAENMVIKAVALQGEQNNRFFHDNVLAPESWQGPYDCIVCVRVLINLRDFAEQKEAIDNMLKALRPGGRLLLIEGYLDGFGALNRLREKIGMDTLKPASINYYSPLSEMRAYLDQSFISTAEFHTGCFDFLTRVVYPSLVGPQNASGHSDFHQKILSIAKDFNPDALAPLARLHGFALVKR